MPETSIGLFPDVGMMQLLAALPGEFGPWLAMTGARLRGESRGRRAARACGSSLFVLSTCGARAFPYALAHFV